MTAEQQQIEEFMEKRRQLLEKCSGAPQDLDTMMALYAENASFTPPREPRKGDKGTIREFYERNCRAFPNREFIPVGQPSIRLCNSTTAIVNQETHVILKDRNGKVVADFYGRETFTLVKQKDRWVILDHTTSRSPE
ncbi:MAG: nuclear transport factor 2 family protein [Deltaproteobacteria bacterium]|nr:nuclear transport factor 2 family protein [Deltaproteobacteria bacterium]